jgi:hypothetical protein
MASPQRYRKSAQLTPDATSASGHNPIEDIQSMDIHRLTSKAYCPRYSEAIAEALMGLEETKQVICIS